QRCLGPDRQAEPAAKTVEAPAPYTKPPAHFSAHRVLGGRKGLGRTERELQHCARRRDLRVAPQHLRLDLLAAAYARALGFMADQFGAYGTLLGRLPIELHPAGEGAADPRTRGRQVQRSVAERAPF